VGAGHRLYNKIDLLPNGLEEGIMGDICTLSAVILQYSHLGSP